MSQLSIGQRALIEQGYDHFSREELNSIGHYLRLTPTLSFLLTLTGILNESLPLLLFSAVVSFVAVLHPKTHLYDALYNLILAPIVHSPKLPASPIYRRLSYFTDSLTQLGIAVSLYQGNLWPLMMFSILYCFSSIVHIASHFNASSWLFRYIGEKLGYINHPLEVKEAKQLHTHGALLLDLRPLSEYEEGHISGALHIPLSKIRNHILIKNKDLILYCKDGKQCERVHRILTDNFHHGKVYIFGSMCRWQ